MSASISRAFYQELLSTLSGVVDDRVHPINLPPSSPLPAATYWMLHAGESIRSSGPQALYQTRFQVDIIADDLETVVEAQQLLSTAMLALVTTTAPKISRAEVDFGTWVFEDDLQKYRSITGISLYSEGL